MRWLVGNALVLLTACGEPSWQEIVDDYADAICNGAYDCGTDLDVDQCIADVRSDLAEVRREVTSEDEALCMTCMQTVSEVVGDVVESGCQSTAAQNERIYDACDLDPAVDFDKDGNPANDDEEACAGLP